MLVYQNKFRKSVFVDNSAKVAKPSNNSARNHVRDLENGIHWNVEPLSADAINDRK